MKTYALQFAEKPETDEWRPTGGEADYCSQAGAGALKAIIEAYWAARGQHVSVALHNVGFHPAIRAARFDVRSDMVNGRPRSAAPGAVSRAPKKTPVLVEDFNGEDADLAFD